jgi:anti-sigma factor RsiW
MSEIDDDGLLVAFADGKLDVAASHALEGRLAVNAALRDRLADIRNGGVPFAPAFEALLATAPVARMEESLRALLNARPVSVAPNIAPFAWNRFTRVAAAITLLFLGIGLGRLAPTWSRPPSQTVASSTTSPEDWRDVVAKYASLYTEDTFAAPTRDLAMEAAELDRLGAKVDVNLTPDRVSLANEEFRGVQILSYDGAPLGQIAYVDNSGRPTLFCIFANGAPDSAVKRESRGDYALASWASGGHGYMVIARGSQDQVAELAATLMPKF